MSQEELELDETDRGILQILQHDARRFTTQEIGDRVGVSGSTVSNRVADLEEAGVIRGYTVLLDFDQAGVNPTQLLVCTASAPEREALAEEAAEMSNVVDVRTVLSGKRNVHVTVVGRDVSELAEATEQLEAIGLTIVDSGIVNAEYHNPFDGFGTDAVESR